MAYAFACVTIDGRNLVASYLRCVPLLRACEGEANGFNCFYIKLFGDPVTFDVGTTVSGKYRIDRKLGEGGMGTVWLATHLTLERFVALKLLHSERPNSAVAVERLIREGRALARLRGEHIARVIDVEIPERGPTFLVLEYLDGTDLGSLVRSGGPLPIATAIHHVIEVCEALAEAHDEGIIHRDVKPSNLILTTLLGGRRGIKVIDFGISKQVEQFGELTHSGAVLGSPQYMAPEQMRAGDRVDARSDIWSLGVTLYELLIGKRPYNGSNVLELCASILESSPPSPRALRPDVPLEVDVAVRRCLARNPEDRFSSVRELALALSANATTSNDPLDWCLSSVATVNQTESENVVIATNRTIRPDGEQTVLEVLRSKPKRSSGFLLSAVGISVLLLGGFGFFSRNRVTARSTVGIGVVGALPLLRTQSKPVGFAVLPLVASDIRPISTQSEALERTPAVLPGNRARVISPKRIAVAGSRNVTSSNPSAESRLNREQNEQETSDLPNNRRKPKADEAADPIFQYGRY